MIKPVIKMPAPSRKLVEADGLFWFEERASHGTRVSRVYSNRLAAINAERTNRISWERGPLGRKDL